uniref:G-protein coupled receptors family 1 profile domain-containing protein n=1 Tax=Phasianus colchicus TaxID=9054 RepID=A0A669PJV1_PHACC
MWGLGNGPEGSPPPPYAPLLPSPRWRGGLSMAPDPGMNISAPATCVPSDPVQFVLLPIVYCLVLCVGLPGNLAALLVFLQHGKVRKAIRIYLINLTLADILFNLTLPLWIPYYLGQPRRPPVPTRGLEPPPRLSPGSPRAAEAVRGRGRCGGGGGRWCFPAPFRSAAASAPRPRHRENVSGGGWGETRARVAPHLGVSAPWQGSRHGRCFGRT